MSYQPWRLLNASSNRGFASFLNSTNSPVEFPIVRLNLKFLSSWVVLPDSVTQPWKTTTETVAITANTITIDVPDGVFIRPSGLTQRPRADKHKIRQEGEPGPIHSIDFARNADSTT